MEGKRLVYTRRNGELEVKEVTATPEGIVSDKLRNVTNWQARILYLFLTSDQTELAELLPPMINPETIPNKRYLANISYGPGYKGAIQKILRRYNPKTALLSVHLDELAKEGTMKTYLRHLLKVCSKIDPDAVRQVKLEDIKTMNMDTVRYNLDKFESIYFPYAANKYLRKHGKSNKSDDK